MRKDVATSSSSLPKVSSDDYDSVDGDVNGDGKVVAVGEVNGEASVTAQDEGIQRVEASESTMIEDAEKAQKGDEDEDFSSKSQIMTLMTTDVDRVSDFR